MVTDGVGAEPEPVGEVLAGCRPSTEGLKLPQVGSGVT